MNRYYNLSRFYNDKIVIYKEFYNRNFYAGDKASSLANLENNKVKGKFSKKSEKRMHKVINNWVSMVDAKVSLIGGTKKHFNNYMTFVTLTLSSQQKHDDKWIKRHIFNSFLIICKRKWAINNFLWVSEAQSNGNIHFHAIFDGKIPKAELQSSWNKIQQSHGYLDDFISKFGHVNAPSTRIESFRKVNNIAAYLVKYFTKDDNSRAIEGRLWGCSDKLKMVTPFTCAVDNDIEEILFDLENDKDVRKFHDDFFSVYDKVNVKKELQKLDWHFDEMLNHYYDYFKYCYEGGELPNQLKLAVTPPAENQQVRMVTSQETLTLQFENQRKDNSPDSVSQ